MTFDVWFGAPSAFTSYDIPDINYFYLDAPTGDTWSDYFPYSLISHIVRVDFGPSVAVQAVSRSDDGTTIIIDFFSFGPSVDDQAVSLSDDGTTIIIDFFSFLFSLLPPFNSSHSPLAF